MLRNLKFGAIVFFNLLLFSGCENFLEGDNAGRASIPVFFSDVDGITSAIIGSYSRVYEYYDSEFYLYPEVAGDLLQLSAIGENVKMFSQYNFVSEPDQEATAVGHIWAKGYEALANVNNILEYQPVLLEKFPNSSDDLRIIRAEALFLRALIHFDLVRTYAQTYTYTEDASHIGIPALTLTPAENELNARNTTAIVYDQIITDLQESIDLFSEFPETELMPYRGSEMASRSLLSKIFLYMNEWESASEQANIVLSTMKLTVHDEYVEMFRTLEPGAEAIFMLSGEQKKSSVGLFYATADPVATASSKLIDVFSDTSDVRLDLLREKSGTYQTLKYSRPDVNQTEYGSDLYVLRASEILLIHAEAAIELNDFVAAKEDIIQIQSRALGVPKDSLEINLNTKDELLAVLEKERIKELNFEGQRLFDITRWHHNLNRDENTPSNVKELAYPSHLFALPIPLREINANENIIQNEGY
ncbi:RagB/SusD family nutrient uptake outer membrane protein [Zunongwangia sp. HGR-M22]|uniref:RagB/SusD family nutrient uptake outer membrane protein n=1 Tax=Zunongwangia sp. HGR-M22 TaxID=3015168 RepID=UPI0022DE0A44|nr:RagB/SusD family nutrient uptake outer membrane protein [Zunongwangia sp. HGR-M22]WBL26719.1 RagB/SusD family nutrient uptake outer membrane protein [Zunongwangia sp. HGR-M22]